MQLRSFAERCRYLKQSTLRQTFCCIAEKFHIMPKRDKILSQFYFPVIFKGHFSNQIVIQPMTPEERKQHLEALFNDGWVLMTEKDAIKKRFTFKNFNQAFGFMTQVAMAAEKANHHPEWSNVYNYVDVLWTTHASHGLTIKDVKLATFCDSVMKQSNNK